MYHCTNMGDKVVVTPVEYPPSPDRELPTPAEQWYLACLREWCTQTGRAPSITEMCKWIHRTRRPTWNALSRLEEKGYTTRVSAENRRFIPIEFRGVIR